MKNIKQFVFATIIFIVLIFFTTGCFLYIKYDDERIGCKFSNDKYEVYLYLNHDTDKSLDIKSEVSASKACELLRKTFPRYETGNSN